MRYFKESVMSTHHRAKDQRQKTAEQDPAVNSMNAQDSDKILPVQRIGVLGAGQMGCGVAQVCALSGFQVTLIDVSQDQLDNAKELITKHLRRQVERERIKQADMNEAMDNLSFVTELVSPNLDLLIEAVSEDEELKLGLIRKYSDFLNPETIIASNTSSISLTLLSTAAKNPDKIIGMHFMNPVPLMQLVEVIRSLTTSESTYRTVQSVVEKLNKTSVTSQDFPGFIVNRILMPMINEAIFTLQDGVASAEDIDNAMKLGTNQPMGPLALADFIGLDTCLAVMQVLQFGFGDSKYRPCPLLQNYVNAGWLGCKTGRGFYTY